MNISTALIRTNPADDPTSGLNGALVHGSLSEASPGRTLALFYSSLAQTIEAKANRAAHNWGIGPAAITEQISIFFGTGKERSTKLEELRSNGYSWLEERCSKLTEYALPCETAKTQLQAFRSIVTISTRYPGCRDLCLKSQHLRRAGKDEAAISAVWARSDDYRPPKWNFFYKFAAACLSEADVSGILAGFSPRLLGSVQVENGMLSVIEQLLVASECSDSATTGPIARRYLLGVLELPTFWDESGPIHTAIFHKLVMWLILMLKDHGLDSVDTEHTPEMNMDIETIDSMVATVLSGVCRWAITMDLESQCWFGSLEEVVHLLRGPQAEELLPSSWKLATCSEVRELVPGVTGRETLMTVETSFISDEDMSMAGRTLGQPINKPTLGPGLVPYYLEEIYEDQSSFVTRRRRLTRRAPDWSVKDSQTVPRNKPRTSGATLAGAAHSDVSSAVDVGHGRLGGDGGEGVCAPSEQTQHPTTSPLLTSLPLDCAGRKKALLVAIRTSRTGGYPELKVAHDDAYKMQKRLLDVYNYPPSEITILMDDGLHVEPTRDNVLAAIADLVKDVKDGDQLFFYYSGHSIKVESLRSKSEDGKDECLVPLDGEEMKITDNELHASLVAPLPAGAHLVAVLDTCYLGSLLDLKHYRYNRVPVPWLHRRNRNRKEPRNRVVRLGARLLTHSQTSGPAHRVHKAPSMPAKRRSISTAPPMHILTGLERAGTGSGPAKGPLARLRNASASARARAASLSLSLSIPAPASEDNENLTEGAVGPALSAISKLTWSLLDEEAHCESPVGQFPCNGWCRNLEGHSTCVAQDADGEVNADVVSLASRDSQEADGVSMTSSLIVLVGRSTASLDVTPSEPVTDIPPNARLVRRPTFRTAFPVAKTPDKKGSLVQRIVLLRQKLLDVRKDRGYDMDAFQNPELATPKPLDMNRPWRM